MRQLLALRLLFGKRLRNRQNTIQIQMGGKRYRFPPIFLLYVSSEYIKTELAVYNYNINNKRF